MRRWEDSVFVFISTNTVHVEGGVEERWIPVMQALMAKGAGVRFLAVMGSPMGEWARELGIQVDPYILDKWNVVRSRSRLRKYLKRYVPVAAHSTGLEADLLLRWAARKVPETAAIHTLTSLPQQTRRRRPINALMRRFDEVGMRSSAAVFVGDESLAAEVRSAGVAAERVVLDPPSQDPADERASIAVHLALYQDLMAQRGAGS